MESKDETTLTVKCPECKYKLVLGPVNSILVMFAKNLPLSFMQVTCPRPQCEHTWYSFIADDYEIVETVTKTITDSDNWLYQLHQYPQSWVYKQFADRFDYEFIKFHKLTPRHEELIETLRETLERTPDEYLMDIFSSIPPKSPLPSRWI